MVTRTLLRKGCELSWVTTGTGPPVIMIHGVGIGAKGWQPQYEDLSNDYECVTFDNRGFGASQPIGAPLTVDLMAEDVLALMDAQGWPTAHVVGHSLGGLVALFAAQRAPRRIRSLTLISTFANGSVPTRFSARIMWIGIRTRIGSRTSRRNAFLELVMPQAVLESADRAALARELAELFGHDLADQPPVAMKQFAAMRKANAMASLDALRTIPTLVITGSEDLIAPPSAGRTIVSGIQGARFVEIPGAAHGVTIQMAPEVNALIREHLAAAEARD